LPYALGFINIKSGNFDMFLAYKALVERKFEHQLQKLGTYNGNKYVNNKFTTYCIA
jgi:hypothetical protein